MGEVYRARDTKLNREVAIKVLPYQFTADPDRISRFKREAQVLAALNHPNIAAIYGFEESDGVQALVLELVDGPTLADRVARGPMPIEEALLVARQIADALEAAHEHRIIHRDLKPANIKVRDDGSVKVLDFGLAKMLEAGGAGGPGQAGGAGRDVAHGFSPALTNSPTFVTPGGTMAGVILGTAAYMSPEQAKGQPADRRSDMWAFGSVLFELLTGQRAFPGDDLSETLASVIKSEPAWHALPAETSEPVRRLLRRCLAKDPRTRVSDASVARLEIDEALGSKEADRDLMPTGVDRRERRLWASALGLLVVISAAVLIWSLRSTRIATPEMRLQIDTPSTAAPLQFALSPDGRHIVFAASGDGPQRLWLRALDRVDAQPLVGTDGASYPFWSPDSRSVGFFASNKLFRIDIAGGPPQALTSVPLGRGGAWSADGTILFTRTDASPLLRVAASGGESVAVTRLDPLRQTGHRIPRFLPDGRHFLFYATGNPDASGIYLGSLDGGEPKRLTAADSAGVYLPPDLLLFIRQGTLVARRLDASRSELVGDPVTVAASVGYDASFVGGFSATSDGLIAYRAGSGGRRTLTWFDRAGKSLGAAGEPDPGDLLYPELSPDGRRVAVNRTVQNNLDVWLLDLVRGGFTRLTFDPSTDYYPVWSPDAARVAFISNRKGTFNVYVKPSSGIGAEDLLLETPNIKVLQDWSKDGQFLLYYEVNPTTGRDLWALPMTGTDRMPRVVANSPFDERHGQFSPDGRFVAYATDESGRLEVVVQSFPEPKGRWIVSTNGGVQPRWRADGGELYFLASDGTLMAASVQEMGSALEIGTPVALFPTRTVDLGTANFRPQYAVSRDGRFLVLQPDREDTASPITLLINWKPKP
jgi:serine/threonine protein kinase/Tol biopolymer transport system component